MIQIENLYRLFQESSGVFIDSRKVTRNSIFIGLRGDHHNGNLFAADALASGALCAIVDDPDAVTDRNCIFVHNSLETLQALAKMHRSRKSAIIIGITGTNGKTTTKELIGAVLASSYRTIMTPGNLNNHIGVPLTILSLKDDTDYAVVEMGANHQGEIALLSEIADPDFGIITNIGKAHLEGFGGFSGVVSSKSELYNHLRKKKGVVFLNAENELLRELAIGLKAVMYGSSDDADTTGKITVHAPCLSVKWMHKGQTIDIRTKLIGKYNFENVMAAVCIGTYFKVPAENITRAIENYIPQNNRSQRLDTGKNVLLLDAYNANPSSMRASLENFSAYPADNKMVILGDMLELGESSPKEHSEIILLLKELDLVNAILIGPQFVDAAKGKSMVCFPGISEACDYFSGKSFQNYTILLKGSRKIQLEKLVPFL